MFFFSEPITYLYLSIFFLELYVANLLFFYGFQKRNRFWLRFILGSVLAFMLTLLFVPFITSVTSSLLIGGRSILVFALLYILFLFSYRRSVMDTLFCSVGALLLQNMCATVQDIFIVTFQIDFSSINTNWVIVPVFFLGYFFMWLFVSRRLKDMEYIAANRVMILCTAIVSYFFVCLLFMQIDFPKAGEEKIFICFRALIFGCDLLTLYLMFNSLKQKYIVTEKMIMEQILEENKRQYVMNKQAVEMINMKCHDLKHRLEFLRPADKKDECAIEELKQSILIYESIANTGNSVLDVVLSQKALLCEKNGIRFSYLADGKDLSWIGATDLATLFGNALDNAIEYLLTVEEERRLLELRVVSNQQMVGIHIENYCDSKIEFFNGLPQSTKGDKFYHGFGMKSMRYIVERYHGNMLVRQENQSFLLDITLPIEREHV